MMISACHKAHAPVLTDANGLDTAEALATAWIWCCKDGLGSLLWEVCSHQGTELPDEGAAGRDERLHNIREVEEDIGRFFAEKLQRQEPEPWKERKEQQQLVIMVKQGKEEGCPDREGCDFWQQEKRSCSICRSAT